MVDHTQENVGKDIVAWYIEELEQREGATPEEIRLWIKPATSVVSAVLVRQNIVFKMGTKILSGNLSIDRSIIIHKEVSVDPYYGVMTGIHGVWCIDPLGTFSTFEEALTALQHRIDCAVKDHPLETWLTDDPEYKKFINNMRHDLSDL